MAWTDKAREAAKLARRLHRTNVGAAKVVKVTFGKKKAKAFHQIVVDFVKVAAKQKPAARRLLTRKPAEINYRNARTGQLVTGRSIAARYTASSLF